MVKIAIILIFKFSEDSLFVKIVNYSNL